MRQTFIMGQPYFELTVKIIEVCRRHYKNTV